MDQEWVEVQVHGPFPPESVRMTAFRLRDANYKVTTRRHPVTGLWSVIGEKNTGTLLTVTYVAYFGRRGGFRSGFRSALAGRSLDLSRKDFYSWAAV